MARPLGLEEVAALTTAAVQGAQGASRQVVAAAVAAAMRTGAGLLQGDAGPDVDSDAQQEIAARIEAITPVLTRQVVGQPVCGSLRVARNVACHHAFGDGAQAVRGSVQELRRRQRGGRRRAPGASEKEPAEDEAEIDRKDQESEKYLSEDVENKRAAAASGGLEHGRSSTYNTLQEKLKERFEDCDKEKVESARQEALDWLVEQLRVPKAGQTQPEQRAEPEAALQAAVRPESKEIHGKSKVDSKFVGEDRVAHPRPPLLPPGFLMEPPPEFRMKSCSQ